MALLKTGLFKKKAGKEKEEPDDEREEIKEEIETPLISSDDAQLPKEKKPKDLRFALIRCGGALVLSAVLLFLTGFSALSLIRGPVDSVSVQQEENGAFIKKEVIAVLADYAPEGSSEIYALVPMNGQFVTVSFTDRYRASVTSIMDETAQLIAGTITALDKYVIVQGTVSELSEEQSGLMYEWFSANKAALVENMVISDAYDAADYLSEKVLLVDTVDGRSQTMVMVLSGLAVLLVLYVIAELVLMALGFYRPEKKDEENPETPEDADDGEDKE